MKAENYSLLTNTLYLQCYQTYLKEKFSENLLQKQLKHYRAPLSIMRPLTHSHIVEVTSQKLLKNSLCFVDFFLFGCLGFWWWGFCVF